MADVTPIRPDAPVPTKRKRRIKAPTVSVSAMDKALNEQRGVLFQAMGIVRLVSGAIREPESGHHSTVDAWTSLDGAYAVLSSLADRLQTCETMLAGEVDRGDY